MFLEFLFILYLNNIFFHLFHIPIRFPSLLSSSPLPFCIYPNPPIHSSIFIQKEQASHGLTQAQCIKPRQGSLPFSVKPATFLIKLTCITENWNSPFPPLFLPIRHSLWGLQSPLIHKEIDVPLTQASGTMSLILFQFFDNWNPI